MWVTSQRAQRMVAAHWPVDPADLAAVLPQAVMVDTADGVAWLTVIGMQVTHARPRFLPPVPGLSSFAQIGVRTYVTVEGRPAAWIVRGLAGERLGALLARRVFRLPFEPADVRLTSGAAGTTVLDARREGCGIALSWAASGPPTTSTAGSLTTFLGERDLVVTTSGGAVWAGRVEHEAVPVAPADVVVATNTLDIPLLDPTAAPALGHTIAAMRTFAFLPRTVS